MTRTVGSYRACAQPGDCTLATITAYLKNWIRLQHEYECFFFVADWHALTTHYDEPYDIEQYTFDTVVDWLAAGINPGSATLFVQSKVPEHAELHLLLSMITPVSWLERVPSYKDQQAKLDGPGSVDLWIPGLSAFCSRRTSSIYRAGERAGRRRPGCACRSDARDRAPLQPHLRPRTGLRTTRGSGGEENGAKSRAPVQRPAQGVSDERRRRCRCRKRARCSRNSRTCRSAIASDCSVISKAAAASFCRNRALLTDRSAKVPGVDGEKMSKSYEQHDPNARRAERHRTEDQDDEDRSRRACGASDPGKPDVCPVFALHEIYSNDETREWAAHGCRTAGIGCLECKGPLIDAIKAEQAPIRERAVQYERDKDMVQSILMEGSEEAREVARETLDDVRAAIGISHR